MNAPASADVAVARSSEASELPPYRYDAEMANEIELRWQERWRADGTYRTPNPKGSSADPATDKNKLFIMDMFPYPSGSGLHVGHPLGYIGTDVYARFKRMCGYVVLHPMGYDAFGLPAEEHARQTGEHPRVNTERNIANMSRQLARLGLGHDDQRSLATTDVEYYRWTQWIFLQIFNSWYDAEAQRARPIAELVELFETGQKSTTSGAAWADMNDIERRTELDEHRLAYLGEAPVNWCPALGTVLANEEVTNEGRSDRGNHPVFRRPMKQWMMRITSYADRLLADLDRVDWFESVKIMQRNWIGRSEGAYISFAADVAPGESGADDPDSKSSGPAIEVFTTRPDTIYGTTAMLLAPEHPLVDGLVADAWPPDTDPRWTGGAATPREALDAYRAQAAAMTDLQRQTERDKTGVWLGVNCRVPTNGEPVPVFVADYVLIDYGTGAVMSVPGEDQRDWDFSVQFGLPIMRTVQPPPEFGGEAYDGPGPAINSDFLNGLEKAEAIDAICDWLEERSCGRRTVTYKLRDWLFSRQRYWGEPFPIVFDETGLPLAVPEAELPVELPELIDWAPRALDESSEPEPPLGRATEWATATYDLGDGERTYRRELSTMPQWAGSCWYYLRYLDPTNDDALVDPEVERFWMADPDGGVGGVDLYVGGVEHAVLHLLYARFWHKVLYDLGHVSGPEPFGRLYNQGYIQAAAYQDSRGVYVEASEVVERDGKFFWGDAEVTRHFGKMGKSLRNAVTPDDIYSAYGADTLRTYEMFMGPLDQGRPWETHSVIGSHRLLQRVWRSLVDEQTGELAVADVAPDADLERMVHRTIAAVTDAMSDLRFNSAIARITELNNELTRRGGPTPRSVADVLVRLLAPLVPHLAEELWSKLGNSTTVVYAPFPQADPALLAAEVIEVPVQVNGKVRSRITVDAGISPADLEVAAKADERIAQLTVGADIQRVVTVPGKLVNIVLA
ncbi:leucine--tRNA ligase [Candidatus Poriferisodalis sp.]|uniref:leucine--tRNA ligase n=1 Tax=Candidatus Poriferisodalis sp. TaxID=3101277 RepID=UPI003B01EB47